jgi:hypothetical protein
MVERTFISILSSVPVIDAVCKYLNTYDIARLTLVSKNVRCFFISKLHTRRNLKGVLDKYFDDATTLIEIMTEYRIYIIGSRSLSMLWENGCTQNSDWNFFINHNGQDGLQAFRHHEFVRTRIIESQKLIPINPNDNELGYYNLLVGQFKNYRGDCCTWYTTTTGTRVQIMYALNMNALSMVLRLHSTVVMNLTSPLCTYILYPKFTLKGLIQPRCANIYADRLHISSEEEDEIRYMEKKCIEKYKRRGFIYTSCTVPNEFRHLVKCIRRLSDLRPAVIWHTADTTAIDRQASTTSAYSRNEMREMMSFIIRVYAHTAEFEDVPHI